MPTVQIDPSSPKHDKLVRLVQSRRDFANRELGTPKEKWRSAEKLYRSFVDPDELTPEGKKRNPFEDSIILPLTYALTQTQLAFDLAAFTQRRPMIPLDGDGPEDVRPAKVMEQVLHHESVQQGQLVDLYGWLLDRRRYGVGFLWTTWLQDVGYRTRTTTTPGLTIFGRKVTADHVVSRQEPFVRFEGNESFVADPFKLWWDPRVPVARIQKGEFCGRTVRRSYSYMREQEAAGFYMNVSKIPRDPNLRQAARGQETGGESSRDEIAGLNDQFLQTRGDTLDFQDKGYVDLDEAVIRFIPSDYELGRAMPELWWITLANDRIIVRAEPFDADHQQYPVAAMEASPDPHSRLNPGNVEILSGIARIATWLLNSHVENVKKALNDSLIVNPGVVEMKDVQSPQPGKLIRIKREFYNDAAAFEKAIKQLEVHDVTGTHMSDINAIFEVAQRVAAAPENLQGVISNKDRTLGEQQLAMTAATGRLRAELQLAWVQGVGPWTRQRIANIQQYMTQERWVRIVGDWPKAMRMDQNYPFLRVGDKDLMGQFTYQIIDGTIRTNEEVAKAIQELWMAAVKDQVLRQVYDTEYMFEQIAIARGFTNVDDFLRQQKGTMPAPYQQMPPSAGPYQPGQPGQPGGVRVMPNEKVAREVEKGNLVPGEGPPFGQVARQREQYAQAA